MIHNSVWHIKATVALQAQTKTKVHIFVVHEVIFIESLQGKEVEFSVEVQSVKALELPEVDDAFAAQVGEFETADEMRADILKRLQERNTSEYDDQYLSDLIDEIPTILAEWCDHDDD